MDTRKMCSTLGIVLAFVVVLSLFVAPVLAAEEERGYDKHSNGVSGFGWGVDVYVEGWWDDNDPYVFTDSNAWYDVWGATIISIYIVDGPGIGTVYIEISAVTWTGLTIRVWAWFSPPGYPIRGGGGVETW